jgi:hypothetical protein
MRIEIELLKNKTDLGPEMGEIDTVIMNRNTVYGNFAFLNRLQFVDASYEGAFSRTAGSADDNHFPGINMKIDII